MHILIMTAIGFAALAVFVVVTALISRARSGSTIDGASIFVWVWLVASLANAYNGWANHGIPLVNEIAAFIPIFGVPAAAAWYWSRRTRSARAV
ncbi:MAG: hypothetical protein WD871_07335 [Xanthobacteraceae bacterium]